MAVLIGVRHSQTANVLGRIGGRRHVTLGGDQKVRCSEVHSYRLGRLEGT